MERPLKVWEGFCRAPKSQRLADVVTSCLAELAFEAGQSHLESYPIPHFEIGDF